jgi:flagellar hook-associated protein 1 FlgK
MSLFGAIQLGANTLGAMQIGLQVVGNNIANANTPGYVRQEAIYKPAPVQRKGELILGLGVQVDSIVQRIDRFVQERLIGARGDRANAEVQEQVYRELEVRLNELSDEVDLSDALTGFFNSIHEIMKDPANAATRNLAIGKGVELAGNFNSLHSRVTDLHNELDSRVTAVANEINNLAEEIRHLNVQISSTEGGDTSGSQAGGLRVKRQTAIDRLSELISINVEEQPSGGLAITVGGEFLIFEGQRRDVEINNTDGIGVVEFESSGSPLIVTSGELKGLYVTRDEVTGGFLDKLDNLAHTLAFEFNKLYSQGQGLVGFTQLTSVDGVDDPDAALDAAGLSFTPVSGKFDVVLNNKSNPSLTQTTTIVVDLDGIDDDTTLTELAEQLDAIAGLNASLTINGELQISADSADSEFSFAEDTSGILAALGLNTFFTGFGASSLGVNAELKGVSNVNKFAASLGGVGRDAGNAEQLAAFLDRPLDSAGDATLSDIYNALINEVTQGSSVAKSLAEGFRVFEGTLDGQNQAVSGVSIDEEAVKMITLQRIYQASARYIQTCSELLDLLVNL